MRDELAERARPERTARLCWTSSWHHRRPGCRGRGGGRADPGGADRVARIRAALAQAVPRLPRDHGHLGALEVSSYGYLRQFTPQVLAAVEFTGGTAAAELLRRWRSARTQHLRRPRVPPGATAGFVPTRWRGYLDTARRSGNTSAYRHFWELCVLLGLRDGLRTGDVWVPGRGGTATRPPTCSPPRRGRPSGVVLPARRQVRRPGGRAGRGRRRAGRGAR